MPRTQRDNVFTQSAFQKNVWEVAVTLMTMYENGKLKNQKLNRKHLLCTPEFKQHLFQPLHNLDPEFQLSVMQRAVNEEITLDEMKKAAVHFRKIKTIKATFLRLTSCSSWADAEAKFPLHTTDSRLGQYISLDFKSGIPDVFQTYCQEALDTQDGSSTSQHSCIPFKVNGVSVFAIEAEFSTMSAKLMREQDPNYAGVKLILYNVSMVS